MPSTASSSRAKSHAAQSWENGWGASREGYTQAVGVSRTLSRESGVESSSPGLFFVLGTSFPFLGAQWIYHFFLVSLLSPTGIVFFFLPPSFHPDKGLHRLRLCPCSQEARG